MKAITILQPWASLIALGHKKIETRGWATKHRGKIAIHAGMGKQYMDYSKRGPIFSCLWNEEQINMQLKERRDSLPYGKVIAIADLVDCVEIVGAVNGSMGPFIIPVYKAELENGITVRGNEFAFGHYEIGRYAWILENVQAVNPVPAKGNQRIWNWEVNP